MIVRKSAWRNVIWAVVACGMLAASLGVGSFASDEPWRFAVFCDTRGDNDDVHGKLCVNATVVRAIAAEIVRQECTLVIFPGDLVNGWWANGGASYESQFQLWKNLMSAVYEAGIPVYPVRGNHEDGPGTEYPGKPPYRTIPDPELKAAFLSAFGDTNPSNGPAGEVGLTYSFVYENALFIGLDQYIVPHRVNQTWLEEQLAEGSWDYVFVYGHEPAYQIVHADCLAAYTRERQLFWDSIGAAGGFAYFCGHDHLYDRAHVLDLDGNVIWQLVLGSSGAPPGSSSWEPPHVDGSVVADYHEENGFGLMIVTVDTASATLDWLWWDADTFPDPTWVVADSFEVPVRRVSAEQE